MSKKWVLAVAVAVAAFWFAERALRSDESEPEGVEVDVPDTDERVDPVPEPPTPAADESREALSPDTVPGATPEAELVRGRIVDDASGRPLERVALLVKRGVKKDEQTTDADGAFVCDASIEPGKLSFVARLGDAKINLAESKIEYETGDPPIELRALIGPRYLVEIIGPEEAQAATWTASIVAERERFGDILRVGPRPLEDGDPRSVRFVKRPGEPNSGETYVLRIDDDAGEWSGSIAPPAIVGEPSDVLQIAVSRAGWLFGRLAAAGDGKLGRGTVQLTPAGDEHWPRIESEWQFTRIDDDGGFRFERLEPGDYHVLAAPPFRPMIHRKVHVAAGPNDMGTLEVEVGGETGTVSGVLRSASGRPGIGVIFQMHALDGSGYARSWISGKPSPLMRLFYGGGASGDPDELTEVPFEVADVPAGRYRVIVIPWDGFRYEPSDFEIAAPVSGVEILRLDAGDPFEFGFHVVDAESGEPIDEFMARFHTEVWGKEKSFPHRSGELLGEVVADGDLSWAIFADGYAPVWGDTAAFAGAGNPRFARVELERGWGADFIVRDGRDPRRDYHRAASKLSIAGPGAVPLAGVRVVADGETVGTTDAAGRCRVILDEEPETIELVKSGWVVTPTTTFADGRVLLSCPSPKVWMVPTE